MTQKVDVQRVVDCFAETEKAAVALVAMIADVGVCLDQAARDANAAGLDVRSFDLAPEHSALADLVGRAGFITVDLMHLHQKVYQRAKALDMDVPRPQSGGR